MKRGFASCLLTAKESRSVDSEPTKLFVGNLAPACDDDTLHNYIGRWAKVVSLSIERYEDTSRSLGYAFVKVCNYEAAELCILMLSGTTLYGKRIFVSLACEARKILFGNLEKCVQSEFIKQVHALASVEDIGIGTALSGHMHFSVVTFETHEDAQRVMQYFKLTFTKNTVCARWLNFFPCPWNSSFVRTRHPIEFLYCLAMRDYCCCFFCASFCFAVDFQDQIVVVV